MKQETTFEALNKPAEFLSGRSTVRTLQDVDFEPLTVEAAIDLLDWHVCTKRPLKIAIANAHTLNIARKDARTRAMLAHFLVFNDGIGIDLASLWRYGKGFPANLNGTDFIPSYLQRSSRKLRIFMLGAQTHVVSVAFAAAQRRFPQHEWTGFSDGYFHPDDEAALIAEIRSTRADLLLVAMGNPLQELWIDRCAAATGATLCVGVGALFDFLSGEVDRAPLWVRRIKLEWMYRMIQEPGRMWRRYLIGNVTFLWHAWRERR